MPKKAKPNYDREVILAPKGLMRQKVKLSQVVIPDLWHVYEALRKHPDFKNAYLGVNENGKPMKVADAVLTAFNLLRDFKANLAGDTEA
jgi:hypothetical protein